MRRKLFGLGGLKWIVVASSWSSQSPVLLQAATSPPCRRRWHARGVAGM